MNERLSTRSLADILSIQMGMDKERAEKFIDVLSSYITQGIERNKAIKVMGLGTFKIMLVRERESVHIQTGERFVIPAHHKLSFMPDKDLRDQINRPFAFFEPIEATEKFLSLKNQTIESETENELIQEFDYEKIKPEIPVVILDDDITEELPEEVKNIDPETKSEDEPVSEMTKISEETGTIRYTSAESAGNVNVTYNEFDLSGKDDEDDTDRDKGEQTEPDKDYQIESGKTEKKTTPLWLWFLLLPFLIIAGVGIGTYAFLHYNSGKAEKNTSFLSDNNQGDAEYRDKSEFPLPIGESRTSETDEPDDTGDAQLTRADIENTDSVSTENTTDKETVADSAEKDTASVKNEGKPVIDWLAPSPENTNSESEPKRADKPNAAIEEKNKSLPATSGSRSGRQTRANTTTSTTTGRSEKSSLEKVIPARVRITAGSSLTQIAMEHYGDKIFWVYIYDYNKNRIKDFDNIPVGTEIRLPLPKTYGIDAKNNTSVQKARQKQSELLKWDNWDDYQ